MNFLQFGQILDGWDERKIEMFKKCTAYLLSHSSSIQGTGKRAVDDIYNFVSASDNFHVFQTFFTLMNISLTIDNRMHVIYVSSAPAELKKIENKLEHAIRLILQKHFVEKSSDSLMRLPIISVSELSSDLKTLNSFADIDSRMKDVKAVLVKFSKYNRIIWIDGHIKNSKDDFLEQKFKITQEILTTDKTRKIDDIFYTLHDYHSLNKETESKDETIKND